MVVFDCLVFFGGEPASFLGCPVFGPDGGGPGEGVVDLEEVVVLFEVEVSAVPVGSRDDGVRRIFAYTPPRKKG